MGFFRWLYRLPGRIERNMEKTAIASSVVTGEGMGGTHVDVTAMNAAAAEMKGSGQPEGDSAHGEDS
jgi:hypothetical protein